MEDCFILPIHTENMALKSQIKEMIDYIKQLQSNYIGNQVLFHAMVKSTYTSTRTCSTQTVNST